MRRPIRRRRRRPVAAASPWPIPASARAVLASMPAEFTCDGCSRSPDAIGGYSWRFACAIHDWRYCTRARAAHNAMSPLARRHADDELRANIATTLPKGLWSRWIPWLYWRAVRRFGSRGAWDTCGPFAPLGASRQQRAEGRCRHGLRPPPWMIAAVTGVDIPD